MNATDKDSLVFLKALQQEGIEEIYIPPFQSDSAQSKNGSDSLEALRQQVLPCTLCSELSAKRKNVVFGSGSTEARLMFVGEAPGQEEDAQGLPFVGAAGQLLTKIIESIGLSRKDVFIANVLKCRPPGNRQPKPDEIENCRPYLLKQIEIISPQIVCALGTFAAQTLLECQTPISRLRGQFHQKGSLKIMATFHPAYLLRNPAEKRKVWEDMKMIRQVLDSSS